MERINWTDHVKNKEELHRVKEVWNIKHIRKRRKAKWIVHSYTVTAL
jgi:hypothetical protein